MNRPAQTIYRLTADPSAAAGWPDGDLGLRHGASPEAAIAAFAADFSLDPALISATGVSTIRLASDGVEYLAWRSDGDWLLVSVAAMDVVRRVRFLPEPMRSRITVQLEAM